MGSIMHTETTIQGSPAAANPTPAPATDVHATTPGTLRLIKRNGTVVPYDDSKIAVAITKAFLAVEGGVAAASSRIHESVAQLTAIAYAI